MKTKLYLTICVTLATHCCIYAQFNKGGLSSSYFGQTNSNGLQTNWIRSVGVGNFSNTGDKTHAFLHVNSNYLLLPQNGSITTLGEVFRTTGPSTDTNTWRLFTGAGNGTEKFSLFVPENSNHVTLQVTQAGADMRFNTGGANERLRITADGQVKVNSLQCENCFVITDKDGTLKTYNAKELLSRIENLQQQITAIQQQLNTLALNK